MQQSLINLPGEEPMNFKVIKRKSQRKWIHFVKRAEFKFNHEDGLGGLWGKSISCFLPWFRSLWDHRGGGRTAPTVAIGMRWGEGPTNSNGSRSLLMCWSQQLVQGKSSSQRKALRCEGILTEVFWEKKVFSSFHRRHGERLVLVNCVM